MVQQGGYKNPSYWHIVSHVRADAAEQHVDKKYHKDKRLALDISKRVRRCRRRHRSCLFDAFALHRVVAVETLESSSVV